MILSAMTLAYSQQVTVNYRRVSGLYM